MTSVTYGYKMFKYFNKTYAVSEQAPPPDVKDAFSLFAEGADVMSADQLLRFLHEHQLELDYTAEDSNRVVETVLQSRTQNAECDSDNNGLTLDEFFRFLFLVDFNDPLKSKVPLSTLSQTREPKKKKKNVSLSFFLFLLILSFRHVVC